MQFDLKSKHLTVEAVLSVATRKSNYKLCRLHKDGSTTDVYEVDLKDPKGMEALKKHVVFKVAKRSRVENQLKKFIVGFIVGKNNAGKRTEIISKDFIMRFLIMIGGEIFVAYALMDSATGALRWDVNSLGRDYRWRVGSCDLFLLRD